MINETIEYVKNTLGYPRLPIIVQWNGRFTRRMGDAQFIRGVGIVRLSKKLWERANDEQRRQTIIHEVCHVIQRVQDLEKGYRSPPHGWQWQALMRRCGQRPDRCHTVDRTGIVRTYSVRCACGVHQVGKTVYRRMLNGQKYQCKKCRQKVEPEV